MDDTRDKLLEACSFVGGIMVLAGAVLRMTDFDMSAWIFLTGSIFFAAAILSDRYRGDDKVMKRLGRQRSFGAVLLFVTALLMFSDPLHAKFLSGELHVGETLRTLLLSLTKRNSWIVTMSLSAVILLYSVFRMENKQKNSEDNCSGKI